MNIEYVFRIYHRLQHGSLDLCEQIIIIRDYDADLGINPTAIKVKFIPKKKRELTAKERSSLRTFCNVHNLAYEINNKGEMIWDQAGMIKNGNQKRGTM